jgi:hypothetical protein
LFTPGEELLGARESLLAACGAWSSIVKRWSHSRALGTYRNGRAHRRARIQDSISLWPDQFVGQNDARYVTPNHSRRAFTLREEPSGQMRALANSIRIINGIGDQKARDS